MAKSLGVAFSGPVVADAAAGTAINPPAGGSGNTAGAMNNVTDRDLMLASITALVADVLELKTQLNALMASLREAGAIDT